jgi:hypothetical protein
MRRVVVVARAVSFVLVPPTGPPYCKKRNSASGKGKKRGCETDSSAKA